jgi:hypothetical protein
MKDESTRRPVGRFIGGRASRVRRTGIALVHEGELILPAAGSSAQAERVVADSQSVIHYHFPVEIEVRGSSEAQDPEEIVHRLLEQLADLLENH